VAMIFARRARKKEIKLYES